jgi:hypothetical protein
MGGKQRMTADTVYEALAKRYEKAWALLPQVRNGTGYARDPRTADAVAVSLWPSRGLEIHGIEIKVYHGDFERELRKPEKADAIQNYCHRWWIAAPDETVAPLADMPTTWGLMVVQRGKMKVIKEAPLLTPKPLDSLFVAAVLRKGAEAPHEAEERGYRRGYEDGVKNAPSEDRLTQTRLAQKYESLIKQVGAFETATGLSIEHGWDYPRIGEGVEALRTLMLHSPLDNVNGMMNVLHAMLRELAKVRETAKALDASGLKFPKRVPDPVTIKVEDPPAEPTREAQT